MAPTDKILLTSEVRINGFSYHGGSAPVLSCEESDPPECVLIRRISAVNHAKFLVCHDLTITDFHVHTNTFTAIERHNVHMLHGQKHVILQNVDDMWIR